MLFLKLCQKSFFLKIYLLQISEPLILMDTEFVSETDRAPSKTQAISAMWPDSNLKLSSFSYF